MNKKIVAPLLLSTLFAWRALAHFNFMSNHPIAFCAGVVALLVLSLSAVKLKQNRLQSAQTNLSDDQYLSDLKRRGHFLDCRPKTLGEETAEPSIGSSVTHVAL